MELRKPSTAPDLDGEALTEQEETAATEAFAAADAARKAPVDASLTLGRGARAPRPMPVTAVAMTTTTTTSTTTTTVRSAAKDSENVQAESDKLRQALIALRTRREALEASEAKREQLQADNEQLEDQLRDVRLRLSAETADTHNLRRQWESAKSELGNLRTELQTLRSGGEMQVLRREIAEAKKKDAEKSKQLTDLQAEKKRCADEASAAKASARALRSELHEVKEQLALQARRTIEPSANSECLKESTDAWKALLKTVSTSSLPSTSRHKLQSAVDRLHSSLQALRAPVPLAVFSEVPSAHFPNVFELAGTEVGVSKTVKAAPSQASKATPVATRNSEGSDSSSESDTVIPDEDSGVEDVTAVSVDAAKKNISGTSGNSGNSRSAPAPAASSKAAPSARPAAKAASVTAAVVASTGASAEEEETDSKEDMLPLPVPARTKHAEEVEKTNGYHHSHKDKKAKKHDKERSEEKDRQHEKQRLLETAKKEKKDKVAKEKESKKSKDQDPSEEERNKHERSSRDGKASKRRSENEATSHHHRDRQDSKRRREDESSAPATRADRGRSRSRDQDRDRKSPREKQREKDKKDKKEKRHHR